MSPSPVKKAALELGLDVVDKVEDCIGLGAELGVVVAYGSLIRPEVLHHLDMVNLHFSLLPRWRGAAPLQRAILGGDTHTGVCLMALEQGLDTGPIYDCRKIPIQLGQPLDQIRDQLVEHGCQMLIQRLKDGKASLGVPTPQIGEPTYARKISKEELFLDWQLPAESLLRIISLGQAWTIFRGNRLKVIQAKIIPQIKLEPGMVLDTKQVGGLDVSKKLILGTSTDALELIEVQPAGKKPISGFSWKNGLNLKAGERFGR